MRRSERFERVYRYSRGGVVALTAVAVVLSLLTSPSWAKEPEKAGKKPSPDEVLAMLKEGNARFIAGKSKHPHPAARTGLAGRENQGDYAYATVISCSDSRVPVELIFDAGVMDIFVIRVAGNVCDTDETGSIEYGLAHVHTPVLVVLGHTQCGAVTAVYGQVTGHAHKLERNIPSLVDNIVPAVQRAVREGKDIEKAIEYNVEQGILELYMRSPCVRRLVKEGKVKVVGAIYDVGTGKIRWLDVHFANVRLREHAEKQRGCVPDADEFAKH